MKYDLNILEDYIQRGLVDKNNHPTLPIAIYNYSRECQFLQAWDNITLSLRGVVLDNRGNIVARTFPKIFNMEEMQTIPDEEFEVFEKMDGSLGILFYYEGEWILATRGSFISDQAIKGRRILEKYRIPLLNDKDAYEAIGFKNPQDYTIMGEILYSQNRIVIDYGDQEDFVVLGMINKADGSELPYNNLLKIGSLLNAPVVKRYDGFKDYKKLKSLIVSNQEGFVIRFTSGARMKIKSEEYVRLHRLLTNFSNVDIWECLMNGTDLNDMLERVPDEFDAWVRNTIKNLKYNYTSIQETTEKLFNNLIESVDGELPIRREYSDWVKKQEKELQPILYRMYDRSDYSKYIWKLIRPTYQKPFWNREV